MDEYEVVGKINSGGFGVVYKAVDLTTEQYVAVKELKEASEASDDYARFCREVKIQSSLEHPNIVPILGSSFGSPASFTMPLAEFSLRTLMLEGYFDNDVDAIVNIINQILDGMIYAHSNGVLHRDLKPENILFFQGAKQDSYTVKISDFGLGKNVDSASLTLTYTNVGMGTPLYVSPEQTRDAKHVNEQTDIFSFGKMLQEFFTSELPVHVTPYHEKIDHRFMYIIDRCLKYNLEERYKSFIEVKKDILAVCTEQEKFQNPEARVKELIFSISHGRGAPMDDIKVINQIFYDNLSDGVFLSKCFILLKGEALNLYLSYSLECFKGVLDKFDLEQVGGLSFSYTDKVADFYKRIWGRTTDSSIRRLILNRLLDMGYCNNRWHVGSVFARIVTGITNQADSFIARDILLSNERAAIWVKDYFNSGVLLPVIKDAFPQ